MASAHVSHEESHADFARRGVEARRIKMMADIDLEEPEPLAHFMAPNIVVPPQAQDVSLQSLPTRQTDQNTTERSQAACVSTKIKPHNTSQGKLSLQSTPTKSHAHGNADHSDAGVSCSSCSSTWHGVATPRNTRVYFWNEDTDETAWSYPDADPDWEAIASPEGKVYFWNKISGQTTWESPAKGSRGNRLASEPEGRHALSLNDGGSVSPATPFASASPEFSATADADSVGTPGLTVVRPAKTSFAAGGTDEGSSTADAAVALRAACAKFVQLIVRDASAITTNVMGKTRLTAAAATSSARDVLAKCVAAVQSHKQFAVLRESTAAATRSVHEALQMCVAAVQSHEQFAVLRESTNDATRSVREALGKCVEAVQSDEQLATLVHTLPSPAKEVLGIRPSPPQQRDDNVGDAGEARSMTTPRSDFSISAATSGQVAPTFREQPVQGTCISGNAAGTSSSPSRTEGRAHAFLEPSAAELELLRLIAAQSSAHVAGATVPTTPDATTTPGPGPGPEPEPSLAPLPVLAPLGAKGIQQRRNSLRI